MARYTDAVCRICRREGQKLFLKGDRCYTDKCAIQRRSYAPGQHGQGRNKKLSEYGMQLREKQKARRVLRSFWKSQFAHYFEMAEKKSGMTGENLLQHAREPPGQRRLPRRLCHEPPGGASAGCATAHFTVNGKKVNIPSYLCKRGRRDCDQGIEHELGQVQGGY